MQASKLRPLHDSLISHPNAFQIVTDVHGKSPVIHQFAADSMKDRCRWIVLLRSLAYCCAACSPNDSSAFKTDAAVEPNAEYPRIFRTVRCAVMEGQNMPRIDMIRSTNDTYCVVSFDEFRAAKTITKWNTAAPFWGEEFVFEYVTLASHSLSFHDSSPL